MAIVKRSRYGFAETVARLTATIAEGGNVLFATIDQSAAARTVGLTLRPTLLLVFGNPKGGTPLMGSVPLAALALPLKVLVWDDAGAVSVAHASMAQELTAYGVPVDDPRPAALDRVLNALSDSVM